MKVDFTIQRTPLTDCTIGVLTAQNGFRCVTLELPYKDNEQYISSIPAGTYEYFFRVSPTNGDVLELKHVVGRENIQIHIGNWTRNTVGCILVGETLNLIDGQEPMVTSSGKTLKKLFDNVPKNGILSIY